MRLGPVLREAARKGHCRERIAAARAHRQALDPRCIADAERVGCNGCEDCLSARHRLVAGAEWKPVQLRGAHRRAEPAVVARAVNVDRAGHSAQRRPVDNVAARCTGREDALYLRH
jgi:hypothetical protein